MPSIKSARVLTDGHCQTLSEFAVDDPNLQGTYKDAECKNLLFRVGRRSATFYFYSERRIRGKQTTRSEKLGEFPALKVADARKAAVILAGRDAEGKLHAAARTGLKFSEAFSDYVDHLRAEVARKNIENKTNKPERWADNVAQLGRTLLTPQWGSHSLRELADMPREIRDWHRKISKSAGPVSANRACQVLRATYTYAANSDRSLPNVIVTSAVKFNGEAAKEVGLHFEKFPAWGAAWLKVQSPIRRAFLLLGILTGARPGELCRLRWENVNVVDHTLTISVAKAGADITLPTSTIIEKVLDMAREAGKDWQSEFVFPARGPKGHLVQFFEAGLMHGNALRHTYRTVLADLKIGELESRLLMGHSLKGVNEGYILKSALSGGVNLRDTQEQVSQRIVELLKIKI